MTNPHKLFMPNRQVFKEVQPEKKDTTPKAPDLFAQKFEANAEGKPSTFDYDAVIPKEREEVKNNSKEYQDVFPVLMNRLKNNIKSQAREPRHRDVASATIDGNILYIIIDESREPKERKEVIFKKTAKPEEGATKKELTGKQDGDMSAERIKAITKGYPEMSNPPAGLVEYAKSIFKAPKGDEIKNGDIVAVYQDKREFFVLHDASSVKKFRVFRSPQEVTPPKST